MRTFLIAALALAVSACNAPSRTMPAAMSPSSNAPRFHRNTIPDRGTIISLDFVTRIPKWKMRAGIAGKAITQLGGAPECNVDLYAIRYTTVGVAGEAADADAALFVPGAACRGPYPLVAYAQGTNVIKEQTIVRPTRKNIEPIVVAAIYAAHGYAVVATDYLGLGSSTYPHPPYLVTQAEATAVIDSMRAATTAAGQLNVPLNGQVVITGHSQGGQAALATQRAIEAASTGEFSILESAPSSGPYDLTQTVIDGITAPGQNAPVLATYLITAFQHAYGNVYGKPGNAFKLPYSKWAGKLLPVATYEQAAKLEGKTLPLDVSALFKPAFENSLANDPSSNARVDIAQNDLLGGWTPVAPLNLCGGSKDPQVEYKNSQEAYSFFKGEGANVTLLDVDPFMPSNVPEGLYHDAVLVLCLTINRTQVLDSQTASGQLRHAPSRIAGIERIESGIPAYRGR